MYLSCDLGVGQTDTIISGWCEWCMGYEWV